MSAPRFTLERATHTGRRYLVTVDGEPISRRQTDRDYVVVRERVTVERQRSTPAYGDGRWYVSYHTSTDNARKESNRRGFTSTDWHPAVVVEITP